MKLLAGCVYFALAIAMGYACPTIISRASWGARAPTSTTRLTNQPVQYAFIHHAASANCNDRASCQALVRSFQNQHMNTNGWADIGYSFVIGGDGSIFEGRGWDRVGAHTTNYNSVGLGFCLTGTFTSALPPKAQTDAVKSLIACGVTLGKLRSAYTLRGHRDMGSTECPGTSLFNEIRTWPHY
jgi:N-acetylmuramoyl-L-alanine amidase